MALGKKILKLREAKGLTQDALAKLTGWSEDTPNIGVSQGAISALEKRDSESSKHATAIAKALGVSIDALLSDAPTANKVSDNVATYNARDPVLDDLDALEPEDADVWRAQIRAAAIKARKITEGKMKDQEKKRTLDPPTDKRHAA
ncbi:MAG: helix-turn-helix transcriptional regulator [Sideroxydans sp.]|jgi:transcriptional regulator with XRE-family HTH domain